MADVVADAGKISHPAHKAQIFRRSKSGYWFSHFQKLVFPFFFSLIPKKEDSEESPSLFRSSHFIALAGVSASPTSCHPRLDGNVVNNL